jgi:hypothetical protein
VTAFRLKLLDDADPAKIHDAQRRYADISTTIDDAIAKLAKIVDAGSDGLRGKWVEPLKKDAEEIKDSLSKASVRYEDAATEISRYEPELQHAKTEVAGARSDGEEASHAQNRANAMPDPVPGPDGSIPPEEQQKATDKSRAQSEADSAVTAAKNRLTAALDALDVAGKRLGDAVNCNRYDDGLTDTLKDKINEAFKWISKIFGIIAMVLTALAFLIPGVNALLFLGIAAGAVALIADSVLLAHGEGDVVDVILGAIGLGLAGIGVAILKFGSKLASSMRILGSLRFNFGSLGPGGGVVIPLSNMADIPALIAKPGFFRTEWTKFVEGLGKWWGAFRHGNFAGLGSWWWNGVRGISTLTDLTGILGGATRGMNFTWLAWTVPNIFFALAAGLVWPGGQNTDAWNRG